MSGDSDIQCQVVARDKQVVTLFSTYRDGALASTEIDHLSLTPTAAVNYAEALTTMAFEADTSLKPVGETLKTSLVDQHRARVLPILVTVIRSGVDQQRTPGQIAQSCLDEMCKEVF